MAEPYYDNKSQYDRIVSYLIPGEKLFAVYDCKGGGTGFVGLTDQRIIFYDQGVVFKHKSMMSIPYHRIIAVGSADEGVVFQKSSISIITSAGNFTFEFRGGDKAHTAYNYILNQILNQPNPQLPG